MLTVIGNIRINSLSHLEHFKNSLKSFDGASDNWLINIRGTFRDEAIAFLKSELGNKLVLFKLLDESRGWMVNSLEMLKEAKYDYVLVWNEDHLNIASAKDLVDVVSDMKKVKADYLCYSWWLLGKSREAFDKLGNKIGFKKEKYISHLKLDQDKWKMIRDTGYPYFIISMCGIFRKEFLQSMWKKDQRRLPFFFKKMVFKFFGLFTKLKIMSPYGHKELFEKINRFVFRNKIRKYPTYLPFEMEKGPERVDMLPLNFAFSNKEIFACIDDNVNMEGYSLIDRGLYKNSKNNRPIKEHLDTILSEIRTVLSKVDEKQVDMFVKYILSARRIVASGAGRVGMAVKGFVMRLKHMGLDAYILGDANVPSIKPQDLFLVCSGSGETQTIYELTLIAQKNQTPIALVTGNPESRMGKIANTIVEIKAPSKVKKVDNFVSIQPMTTLNEQSLAIFFDAIVLKLMDELNETHETMWERHSNLE